MRLIDADALYDIVMNYIKPMATNEAIILQDFIALIEDAPTVDAEPVVRCDDCIYRDGKTPGQPNILCWQMHVDDFCSYGTRVDERRENETD